MNTEHKSTELNDTELNEVAGGIKVALGRGVVKGPVIITNTDLGSGRVNPGSKGTREDQGTFASAGGLGTTR